MDEAQPLPPAEQAKATGDYLRGTLAEELTNSETQFSKAAIGVLKFHGVYQQDDRDLRKQGTKDFSNMVRVGVPGGRLSAEQYLTLDRLADIGDGSLRITTRQDVQFHYVPKLRIKELIRGVNESYLGTLAACGDVVRNVVACPAPFETEQRRELQPVISYISRNLKPRTTAYCEVWMDGERAASIEAKDSEVEPLYGRTYLPRKFKVGFCYAGDNTTDIYANDVGIIPHYTDGVLEAFTILAGGGMGQSAGVKASHPRLADPICTIGSTKEELLEVISAIVTIHRDFGNRTNRKLARLKYVMDAWGTERFKQELEARVERALPPPRPLSWTRALDYLGWHRQGVDETGEPIWFVGVRVVSGRVRDFDSKRQVRSGIRAVVQQFGYEVRLTCQQNLYLAGIREKDRRTVAKLLADHGILEPESLPPVLRHAMACPALPTCGQAITESERMMPRLIEQIQAELDRANLRERIVDVRTSGCPNGCSRPYTAEIGVVGVSLDMYNLYLGGSPLGTRLGQIYAQNVKREQIAERLRPAIVLYQHSACKSESFGDFCHRVGMEKLQAAPVLTTA